MYPGAHFDAALAAGTNLTAADVQRTHLAGRQRESLSGLEVRAVAIEYAWDDLQGIAADIKEVDAQRLPKRDPYGR